MADKNTDTELDREHKRLLNRKLTAEIEQIKESTDNAERRWKREYYLKVGTVVGGIISTLVFTVAKELLTRGG